MAQPTITTTTFIQAFELFYTRFVLRDFVGKIVPGCIFLIIAFHSKYSESTIFAFIANIGIAEGLVIASIAWLFALCSQSIHSRWTYFYFPRVKSWMDFERHCVISIKREKYDSNEIKQRNYKRLVVDDDQDAEKLKRAGLNGFERREAIYMRELAEVVNFYREATPDEKAQYERYVVIKEACGNSMFCTILGLAAFLILVCIPPFFYSDTATADVIARLNCEVRSYLGEGIITIFWIASASCMKRDNLYRQTAFLEAIQRRSQQKKEDSLKIYKKNARTNFLFRKLFPDLR